MKNTDELFAKLQALGAGEFGHFNGSLAAHLRGTEALLRAWGANESLCAAGLYHAVYGTDGYQPALMPLADRNVISTLIGPEAEALAYLYGACDRKDFYPRIGTGDQLMFADRFTNSKYAIERVQLAALCELTIANELEIASDSAEFRARNGASISRLLERMSGLVSEAGVQAYRSIFPGS
jgi:hypothetical protein